MPQTNVFFQREIVEDGYITDKDNLCFNCAVKSIINPETIKLSISITLHTFDGFQCKDCSKFLNDQIII